jgi:hypothetical protein
MPMNSASTKLKKLAWAAGILPVLAVTAHLLLPLLVNTTALRLRTASQLAERVGGDVDFSALSPALLPLPHVTVTRGLISRPSTFRLRFEKCVVYPRLWPLLVGRLKIGRLKIIEPDVEIPVSTDRLLGRRQSNDRSSGDLRQWTHQVLTGVAGALGPVVLQVRDGRLVLDPDAQTPVELTQVQIKARVSDKEAALWIRGRSNLVKGFEIGGRIAVDSLDGNGRIQFSGLDTARLRSLGLVPAAMPVAAVEADMAMDIESLGSDYQLKFNIQAPQAVISKGSRRLNLRHFQLKGEGRRTAREMKLTLEQLHIAEPALQLSASATWSGDALSSWIPSEVRLTSVELDVAPVRAAALELAGDLKTVRDLFDIIRDGRIPELDVRISHAGKEATGAGADVGLRGRLVGGRIVLPHDLLRLEQVDGRVVVEKGRLTAEDVSARLGDSFARGGTLILGLFDGTRDFILSFQGALGPRMVDWLFEQGGVPADVIPKAPITVTQARVARNPAQGLDAEGQFEWPGGLKAKAGLQIGPDANLSCQLRLQDGISDASIDFRQGGAGGWQAGFAGKLEKATVDRLLRSNALVLGWIRGDLRVRRRDGSRKNNAVQGVLDFRQISAPAGLAIPLHLRSGRLAGNGAGFDLVSVELAWQDSIARLSGTGTLTDETVNLELALDTDDFNADQLAPDIKPEGQSPGPESRSRIADYPVRGRIKIHAGRMTLKGYRFAPVQAVAILDNGGVSVDMIEAGFCGIDIAGQIRFGQGGIGMLLKPSAEKAALRDTDQCMAGASITERLEGTVSVKGLLESSGRSGEELINNLKGGLDVQIIDGRVYNVGAAGFFTNLLAFISVNQLIDGVMPDLRRNDFQYKSLTAELSFKEGVAHLEEGVLKSNAVNIVANGKYALADKEMNLVLLVSPLTTVDWIVERIPLVGNILQGTLVAVPVGVKGAAADPRVVPLSPTAVGSRLGGILKRTLKTPFRILSPLFRDKSAADQEK